MEAQDYAGVVLFRVHHFLVVCVAEESQRHTVRAQRGFYHIGNVMLPGLLVKIGQVFAGVLLMTLQVVVSAVRNARCV